jgi:hypothetical protein
MVPLAMDTYLVALTFLKYLRASREGWGRAPILSLVVRDAIWAYAVLFSAYSTSLVLGVAHEVTFSLCYLEYFICFLDFKSNWHYIILVISYP